jgi:hypothetical protein
VGKGYPFGKVIRVSVFSPKLLFSLFAYQETARLIFQGKKNSIETTAQRDLSPFNP